MHEDRQPAPAPAPAPAHARTARGARSVRAWLALAAAWLLPATLLGQARLELRVPDPEAFVNEPMQVELTIRNFSIADEPQFPESPQYTVRSGGMGSDSSQLLIVNGRRETTRTRTYLFELTPTTSGVLTIPVIELRVDGEMLRTQAQRVVVNESEGSEPVFVELSAEQPRVYVGQRFKLTLSVWVKPAVARRGALTAREMFSFIDLRRSTFGPFAVPETFTQKKRPGTDAANFYVYTSSVDYVAERPGPLTLSDVAIQMQYPTRFGRDFIGDEVVQGVRRLRVVPKAAPVEVRPLPTEGRPANFAGAVGVFKLTASAKPTSVRVGDPIELTISVQGDGALDTLPPPALADQTALTAGFRVPREALAGEVVRGERRFSQVIRPRNNEVTAIPPLEYPYFNPQTGRYETARSAAIPLRIEAATTLSPADVSGADPPPREVTRDEEPALAGLADNFADPSLLLQRRSEVRLAHVAAATLGPPAGFLFVWGALAWQQRRANVARARRPTALRNALRRLEHGGTARHTDASHAVEAALLGYVADRLELSAAGLTGAEAVERLRARGMSGELLAAVTALLGRCEARRYAGAGVGRDETELVSEAAALLRRLERDPA